MSNDGFFTRYAAFDTDVATWTTWSESLTAIKEAIPLPDHWSYSQIIYCSPMAASYDAAHTKVQAFIDEGVTEYQGFSAKLTTIVGKYEAAEQYAVDQIAQVDQ